jgi:Haem-binding domain
MANRMRRSIQQIGIGVFVAGIALQFIPVVRDNPAVVPSATIYETGLVPANVRACLERSCMNCHSDETRWPWYSYVAPVSWMVAHDVHQARSKMNFSEWDHYSQTKKAHELEEICNEVLNEEMPPRTYTLTHRDARVTEEEREAVCQWTDTPRP